MACYRDRFTLLERREVVGRQRQQREEEIKK
jgi:hypothetical protein